MVKAKGKKLGNIFLYVETSLSIFLIIKIAFMTILLALYCRKYDKSQDFEKDNKDCVNSVDKKKVREKETLLF